MAPLRKTTPWQFSLRTLLGLMLLTALGAAVEVYLPGTMGRIGVGLLLSAAIVSGTVLAAALCVLLFWLPVVGLWLAVTTLTRVLGRLGQ